MQIAIASIKESSFQVTSSDYSTHFLVGNLFRCRKSFSVISIIHLRKDPISLTLEPLIKVTQPEDKSLPKHETVLALPQPPLMELDA